MKILMKGIGLLTLFFISFTPVLGQSNISEKVGTLKNGEKYIELIDRFIEQNKQNEKKLKSIQNKLEPILLSLEGNKYLAVFEYLEEQIVLTLQLQSIGEDINTIIDNVIDDEQVIENNNSDIDNIILFSGFDTFYNDQDKNILAGAETEIYSADINARLEEIEVGLIIAYIESTNPEALKNSIRRANIYLEGSNMGDASGGDIDVISSTQLKIEFDNLEDFILTKNEREYRISLETNKIGNNETGLIVENFFVDRIGFDEVKGLTTGDNLGTNSFSKNGENNSLLPVDVIIEQKDIIAFNTVGFTIRGDYGENYSQDSTKKELELQKLIMRPYGSQDLDQYTYTLVNKDNFSDSIVGVFNNGLLEFDLFGMSRGNKVINDNLSGEDFEIYLSHPTRKDTIHLNLQKEGIVFTLPDTPIEFTSKFENTIDLLSKPR